MRNSLMIWRFRQFLQFGDRVKILAFINQFCGVGKVRVFYSLRLHFSGRLRCLNLSRTSRKAEKNNKDSQERRRYKDRHLYSMAFIDERLHQLRTPAHELSAA